MVFLQIQIVTVYCFVEVCHCFLGSVQISVQQRKDVMIFAHPLRGPDRFLPSSAYSLLARDWVREWRRERDTLLHNFFSIALDYSSPSSVRTVHRFGQVWIQTSVLCVFNKPDRKKLQEYHEGEFPRIFSVKNTAADIAKPLRKKIRGVYWKVGVKELVDQWHAFRNVAKTLTKLVKLSSDSPSTGGDRLENSLHGKILPEPVPAQENNPA